VRPLVAARCQGCHGAAKQFSGLRLDSKAGVEKGGHRGPLSETLLKAVRHEGPNMPPDGKLAPGEIAALERWVQAGLPWPEAAAPVNTAKPHWAFQPVRPTNRWIDDHYPHAKSAPLPALARRASFVLTGLPPEVEDLRQLKSYEAYVDKLLASPHFGERWARHWMDVVRFAETYGYEWNFEIQGAWRYRDYLIRAFNDDLPFPQFIREHIAGDLLPNARPQAAIGTMFFRLGEMGHDNCNQFRELRTDVVDNQIDTLSKAFQGLTVSCARCHDHKIDPIPTEDYYALYGIISNSRPVNRTIGPPPPNTLAAHKEQARAQLAALWLEQLRTLPADLNAALNDTAPHDAGRAQRLEQLLRIDDFASPLYPLQLRVPWPDAVKAYEKEIRARNKFNTEKFVPLADFSTGLPDGWSITGHGARQVAAGDFALATTGPSAVAAIFEGGVSTHSLTDRFNGTLHSPYLPRGKKFVTFEGFAGNLGAVRAVMDHCVIGEDHQLIEHRTPGYFRISNKADQPLPVYVELNTKSDNPRIPERDGRLGITEAQLANPRSSFTVTKAWLHDDAVSPKPALDHVLPLLQHAEPDPALRFTRVAEQAVQRFRENRATAADARLLNFLLTNGVLLNSRHSIPAVAAFRAEDARLPEPVVTQGMGDFDPPKDQPIFVGGQAANPGRMAPRHFLSVLPEPLRRATNRLELANAIASEQNPLTARVYVNRLWHHVFGQGLVKSTDDFGRNGAEPGNLELLDTLAVRFSREGGSTKKLLREMLLSQHFRRAGAPPRRLDAEAIRDSILAVSGRLDRTLYGESLHPRRHTPQDYRRLFQGPLDGDGRRSVYTKITRMEGPRFLEIFDFPAPLQTRGARDVTNVPSQSLALLNDPFVVQQAKRWADSVPPGPFEQRLRNLFEAALARPPSAAEVEHWRNAAAELDWPHIAHAILNLKEFLYVP